MTRDEFDEFSELLGRAAEVIGKPAPTAGALEIWWLALERYDLAAVRRGFSVHLQNPDVGQYMPKPADIIRAIGGTTQDSALRAWAIVDKAVRSVGTYASVVFDDPIVHRVIEEMGGWIALGTKTEDEWPFVGKEFENRYRGYASRGVVPQYQRILLGQIEAHNALEGYQSAPPRLIGDEAKCRAVMSGGSDGSLLEHRPAVERVRRALAVAR